MAYKFFLNNNLNVSSQTSIRSDVVEDDNKNDLKHFQEVESESSSSCICEDEETSNLTGPKIRKTVRSYIYVWQEVERTTFLSGDGKDILHFCQGPVKSEDSSDDSDAKMLGRIQSGATASSSASSTTIPGSHRSDVNAQKNTLLADSFLKLRCEVYIGHQYREERL
ncbi:hypothetical protein U1Q18_041186 [Sarracenia purpurea var. burkii]